MNKEKNFIKLFLMALLISISCTLKVFAFEPSQNQKVDAKKVWKVSFNQELNETSSLNDYIKVLDSNGIEMKNLSFELDANRKTLYISNYEGNKYEKGENYKLVISKNLSSKKGKNLNKDIVMNFNIDEAETFYVAPEGNKASRIQDGSIKNPITDLRSAVYKVSPGDVIVMREGVYNGRTDLSGKRGNENKWYTLKAYPGENVVFDGEGQKGSCIVFEGSSHWKLERLNITNYIEAGIYIKDGCNNISMDNLKIWEINNPQATASGIEGILGEGKTSYCSVTNCEIYNIGLKLNRQKDHGIYIGYGAEYWNFENNNIHNNAGAAIHMYGDPNGGSNCKVLNNKLYNNNYCGLRIANNATKNLIKGNIFYGNKDTDLYINQNSTANIITNNIFGSLEAKFNVAVEDTSYLGNTFNYNTYKKYTPYCVYTPNGSITFSDWKKRGMESGGSYSNK